MHYFLNLTDKNILWKGYIYYHDEVRVKSEWSFYCKHKDKYKSCALKVKVKAMYMYSALQYTDIKGL